MNLDDALESTAPPPIDPPSPDVPKGWESGYEWDGSRGTVTSGPIPDGQEPIWRELIADWGFDPAKVRVVGDVKVKGWDSQIANSGGDTVRLKSYTANIRQALGTDHADIDELCRTAARRKPPRRTPPDECERGMVVALSDWQMGKGEGDGSEGTVARITASSHAVVDRIRELAKVGRAPDTVYLVGLGDLLEQCSGHYASQEFTTDLTRREQAQVIRRLTIRLVDLLVDAGQRVVLTGVGGNHGENRRDGKAYTTPEDNDDLALLDQCAEVFAANPERYADVSVFIPTDGISMTLDCAGTLVGFFHGHLASRGGASPTAKVLEWWKGQIVGGGPTAPASVLVTGHFHHLVITEALGNRTHMQCPAMDPGSRWFTNSTGASAEPGTLTFLTGAGYGPRGWGDPAVL